MLDLNIHLNIIMLENNLVLQPLSSKRLQQHQQQYHILNPLHHYWAIHQWIDYLYKHFLYLYIYMEGQHWGIIWFIALFTSIMLAFFPLAFSFTCDNHRQHMVSRNLSQIPTIKSNLLNLFT